VRHIRERTSETDLKQIARVAYLQRRRDAASVLRFGAMDRWPEACWYWFSLAAIARWSPDPGIRVGVTAAQPNAAAFHIARMLGRHVGEDTLQHLIKTVGSMVGLLTTASGSVYAGRKSILAG
jgi:hypothetical protein